MEVLNHPMVVVTGKGGVGKSTVAAALALAAARDGRRVAVGELGGHARVAGLLRGTGIDTLTVDVHHALTEWLATQLPRRLADLLMRSGAFASLVAAAPGGAELIAITKLWELVQRRRWTRGAKPYDLVIVDAPASGHGAALLRAPRTFADIARVGPIGSQAREVADFLKRDAGFVIVTMPAELPVSETLALQRQLPDVDLVVANAVLARRFVAADVERLRAVGNGGVGGPAAAAVAHAGRVRAQQAQLARLRRGARGPVVTLPWMLDVEPDELASRLITETRPARRAPRRPGPVDVPSG
jgi:anion-transporting  ArsA/GET3 family ATPase